ncbi:AI-2E family transporter [Amaricoccus sp.]|uniref:AI-2E family transporter n=1 Tax=Amaricoccus sp. TaxID=1872485 RepID=UPI001B6CAFA2|nr:AI-2E family transporter [Amaricoccus sp.]MBP7001461.1 AI-2E family transporter [Amaricoccus sp.]
MHPDAPPPPPPRSPERVAVEVALHLAVVAVFLWLAVDLFRPFLHLALWTAVIAAVTHPAFLWVRERTGLRPGICAALVTLAAALAALGPLAVLTVSLAESAAWLAAQARSPGFAIPDPPPWILELPVAGKVVAANWDLATTNLEGFFARYAHLLIGAGERAALPALHFAETAGVILAAVGLSGFLLVPGERLGGALRRLTARVADERAARFVDIAVSTVRNVARGVIGVAAVQALFFGIGVLVAEVPGAGLLTLVALVCAIVQIGLVPLTAPLLLWAWLTRDAATAALMSAWFVPVALLDMPLKPLMLGRSLSTPTLVIFAGVIAGTVAYGLIGLFVGPILLAIVYETARAEVWGASPPEA